MPSIGRKPSSRGLSGLAMSKTRIPAVKLPACARSRSAGGAGEVLLLVRELLHAPDARHVGRDEEVLVRLEMNAPRVGRAGKKVDEARMLRIADVEDRDAVAERLAEVGVAAMDHDLHAVTAAGLVGVTHEGDVAGCDALHLSLLGSFRRTLSRDSTRCAT